MLVDEQAFFILAGGNALFCAAVNHLSTGNMADDPTAQNENTAAAEAVENVAVDGEQAGEDGEVQHDVAEAAAADPPACPILAKIYGDFAFEPVELVAGLPISRVVAAVWLESGAEVRFMEANTQISHNGTFGTTCG